MLVSMWEAKRWIVPLINPSCISYHSLCPIRVLRGFTSLCKNKPMTPKALTLPPSLFFSYFFSPSHSLSLFLSFSTRNVIIQHRANGEQTAKNHASDNYFLDVPYDTRCCDRCRYNCGLDIDLTVVIHMFLWIQTRRKDIAIQHEEIWETYYMKM